ncbi:MAG: LysR family transcriptional regulator [Angelakisella sp.]|nr:LysR family transcriptional regulator [Angelakisella sp.]
MNLLHLKYAVEVSRTASITQAAEKLYISQPNLSRAIKELESTLGITIFKRTSKGMRPTPQGEEFLGYAKKILDQVDAMEEMYRGENAPGPKFSISVPRASYISRAFTEFTKKLDMTAGTELFYKETNSMRAVSNIINADYKLGILRYQSAYDRNFKEMLEEKGLRSELICEFKYVLCMGANHPLAQKKTIEMDDLEPYTEVVHADPFVPSLPLSSVQKAELSQNVKRHIFVFERASQMELLAQTPGVFMWVSPVPQELLDRYGLVQRDCPDNQKRYKDVLICKKDYSFTALDKLFIDELMKLKRGLYP